jgi:hypothetical protein
MTYSIAASLVQDVTTQRAVIAGLADDSPELAAALVVWSGIVDAVIIDIETQIAGYHGPKRRALLDWSGEWADAYTDAADIAEQRDMINAARTSITV